MKTLSFYEIIFRGDDIFYFEALSIKGRGWLDGVYAMIIMPLRGPYYKLRFKRILADMSRWAECGNIGTFSEKIGVCVCVGKQSVTVAGC